MPAKRVARRRALIAGLGLLAGCGFQLRESVQLPFRTLYADLPKGSSLAVEFARQARQGTTLVPSPEGAEAVLREVSEVRLKEPVSFSPSGRPREYELSYRVRFRLDGPDQVELLPPTEITIRRYITTSDIEQLSEELEEAFLYSEMENDMVQQILRRLGAVKMPR
ncbi:MAG: LPS assembly lipoprotein LptE [Burkholderiaceae bacterium]